MLLPRAPVTAELRLTAGMVRLAVLAAFIMAIGMIRTHLTHERAWILVGIGAGVAVAGVEAGGTGVALDSPVRSAEESLSAF